MTNPIGEQLLFIRHSLSITKLIIYIFIIRQRLTYLSTFETYLKLVLDIITRVITMQNN